MIAYLPRSRTSVAIVVNEDDVDVDDLLEALLRALPVPR